MKQVLTGNSTLHLLSYREKLRESETELQRKKAYIDDIEPKYRSTGKESMPLV